MSSEANYSFTTKVNGDLLTVRGDNAVEFGQHLDAFLLSDALIDKVIAVQRDVRATVEAVDGGAQLAAAEANLAAGGIPVTPVAPAPAAAPAAPEGVETVQDRFGNNWTYGLPQAPDGINGKFVLKEGRSKTGKPYKGWFDRTKGPKPCKPVAPAEDPQFID